MGKYIQLSRCYFDDKDMSDILSNGVFSVRFLLQFARGRGIFISHKQSRENIIRYLSRFGFSWQELLAIAARINSEDAEERQSTRRIEGVTELEQVEQVVKEVQEERGPVLKEVYSIQKRSNTIIEVEVRYVEMDTSKQKVFQRREITAKLEFEKVGDRIDVRHPQNETCKGIAKQIIEKLQKLTARDLKTTTIELTGIRDPAKRTAFFLSLTQNINNFRHIDVVDLKVGNRFPDLDAGQDSKDGEAENAEQEETQEEAEIKSLVKHAALSGQGLLTSDLYKKLRETGYYMSSVMWSAKETVGEERLVEFVAGFAKPVEAAEFFYDVKKIYPRDDPEDKKRTQGELFASERPRLRRLLENAAYESLAALQVDNPD